MEAEVTHLPEDPEEEFPRQFAILANGHWVEFTCRRYWLASGVSSRTTLGALEIEAVRVCSNEEPGCHRSKLICELRNGADFDATALPAAWDWLRHLFHSRDLYDYDSLEELLEDFSRVLAESAEETAIAHYEHLPELTAPKDFDRWDDSLANDQEDTLRSGGTGASAADS